MCINLSDEYLNFCDCQDEAGPEQPKQNAVPENTIWSSDPWSGLYCEARRAATLSSAGLRH